MTKPIFKELISPDEAREILFKRFKTVREVVEVDITDALNRVLAEDIYAPINLPPFTRSLRDGYAVRNRDISVSREDRPVKLRVIGRSEPGKFFKGYVNSGEAVEVATGAPIPPGTDTIVMEEYTTKEGEYVYVYKASPPGEWIQYAGSDISKGDLVYSKGILLGPREVGVLAGLGIDRVKVYRGLEVGVISSGDEVVEPGRGLGEGEIYDVNSYSIYSLLIEDGCRPKIIGIARDDFNSMYRLIDRGIRENDVVIFSGATSVGVKDLLHEVINSFDDVEILFYGVRQRPGKPTISALIRGKLFIGLPGFPVSAMMVYIHIFSDVLRSLNGLGPRQYLSLEALSGRTFRSVHGLRHLYPVFIRKTYQKIEFYPIRTDSGAIVTLSLSDGFIIIPDEISYVEKGDRYRVYLFGGQVKPSDLISFTSHSVTVDKILARYMENTGYAIKRVHTGSVGALTGVRDGYSDFGTTHLFDGKEYNISFIDSYNVGNAVLLYGFWREIGFVVGKGNPHGIRRIEDVIEKDVRFINRPVGTGIRTFLDLELMKYAEDKGLDIDEVKRSIVGYNTFAKTHSAVVSAVEQGLYDVGISAKEAVKGYNVDFIHLKWERVDFILNRDRMEEEPIKRLIDFLGSDETRKVLEEEEGIKIDDKYLSRLV